MTARDITTTSGAGHAIVRAGEADTGLLSQVIADAFFPLDVSRWLIPDGAARREIFPGYFRMHVEHAVAGGLVHTTADRAGAALWIPAGPGLSSPPDGYAERLAKVTGPWAGRFEALDAAFDRHHPGVAHQYLAILAVRPDRQGQGLGTALLRARHAVLDQDGLPAYLEASDRRTRRLYLAHGYADHDPTPLGLPGGPDMYPMWRPPA